MQVIINGFISGLVIAVLALGFASVYRPTKVFHIALGGIYALAPYLVILFLDLGCHYAVSIFMSIIVAIILSIICEVLNHYPLTSRSASDLVHLISSLGIYIVIVQIVEIVWGSDVRTLRYGMSDLYRLGPWYLVESQIINAAVSVGLIFILLLWFRVSRLGLYLRALAANPHEFVLRGYSIRHFRLWSFGLAGGLAAVSSILFAYDGSFDPNSGLEAVILAVISMIIGGRDGWAGPVVGGILLGLVSTTTIWFFSTDWVPAVIFGILILVLLWRSQGLEPAGPVSESLR